MRARVSLLVAVQFAFGADAFAQGCCGGSPRDALETRFQPASVGTLGVSLDWRHAGASQLDRVNTKAATPLPGDSTVDVFLLGVGAGLTPWLAAALALPFVRSHLKTRLPDGRVEDLGETGMGDLNVDAQVHAAIATSSVALGVGVRAPTGESRAHDDGVLIPPALQAGTGHWQGVAGLNVARLFAPPWRTWVPLAHVATQARWPVGAGDDYRAGAAVRMALGGGISWRHRARPSIEVAYDHLWPDALRGDDVPDTGSDQVGLAIGTAFIAFPPWLELRASVARTLWRRISGTQLVGDWQIASGLAITADVL